MPPRRFVQHLVEKRRALRGAVQFPSQLADEREAQRAALDAIAASVRQLNHLQRQMSKPVFSEMLHIHIHTVYSYTMEVLDCSSIVISITHEFEYATTRYSNKDTRLCKWTPYGFRTGSFRCPVCWLLAFPAASDCYRGSEIYFVL